MRKPIDPLSTLPVQELEAALIRHLGLDEGPDLRPEHRAGGLRASSCRAIVEATKKGRPRNDDIRTLLWLADQVGFTAETMFTDELQQIRMAYREKHGLASQQDAQELSTVPVLHLLAAVREHAGLYNKQIAERVGVSEIALKKLSSAIRGAEAVFIRGADPVSVRVKTLVRLVSLVGFTAETMFAPGLQAYRSTLGKTKL